MALVFVTNAAVISFFRRRKDIVDANLWQTVIAPVLSLVGTGMALYLAITDFKLLTGGSSTQASVLQSLVWAVLAVGIVLTVIYRFKRPQIYARIGRQKIE